MALLWARGVMETLWEGNQVTGLILLKTRKPVPWFSFSPSYIHFTNAVYSGVSHTIFII